MTSETTPAPERRTDDGREPAGSAAGPGTADTAGPAGPTSTAIVAMSEDPRFAELRRRFRIFVFPMTVAFLAWYLLYVLLSGYARDLMGTKVVGNINIALVFGVLQFASTFLIAWLYSRYANSRLDPMAEELKEEIE